MSDIAEYLPPLLRHDGVCVLRDDGLAVRDRRAAPFEEKYVLCRDAGEVAAAIRDMVTQGGGPLEVALQALRLVARKKGGAALADFRAAAGTLSRARPTNTTMARTLARLLDELAALDTAGTLSRERVDALVLRTLAEFDAVYMKLGSRLESLLGDDEGILTTCFAEHSLFIALALARERGKRFRVIVPETRPYLQGARLTAPSLADAGFPHVLITDGMPAHFMAEGKITKYVTASDLALRDGTIVNKVGTLANAVAAAHFGIPYYATSMGVDPSKRSRDDIVIEYRDPAEVRSVRGAPTTREDVSALYPCFDVVPAELVSKIITPEEILCPNAR